MGHTGDYPKIFIAIAGNIGAGKTTLTNLLSRRFGWKAHFESVADNPYLSDFYADMNRWSFPAQVFFLNHRFQAHQTIVNHSDSAIQDRCIYEDASIFARGLFEQGKMDQRDYRNYLSLYSVMCQFLNPPDLVIYLRKTIPKLRERIKLRGRDFERNISVEYLTNLNRYYDEWMGRYDLGKKLVIESDDLDILHSQEDFDTVSKMVLDRLDQRDLFHHTQVSEPASLSALTQ